jgi:hypothetical protein
MIDGRKARKAWHSAARPARPARRISLFRGHFPPLQAAFGHATIPQFVIPIPNRSAIFAGFSRRLLNVLFVRLRRLLPRRLDTISDLKSE